METSVVHAGRVAVGEPARGALGELAVDDQPEAFLEAEGLDLG